MRTRIKRQILQISADTANPPIPPQLMTKAIDRLLLAVAVGAWQKYDSENRCQSQTSTEFILAPQS